jgi:hypothetical protein
LKDRIDALRDQFQASYENGRHEISSQIPKDIDVESLPIWYVLEKALDELEGHRARSRKARSNAKTPKAD